VATSTYMQNRKKWNRPQGLLFSDNSGTLQNNFYIPTGNEFQDFIILSDHNRSPASIAKQRIENRSRMINGGMRSYFTADKISLSVSWERLPSRAFSENPNISGNGVITNANAELHTVDNGAGGSDLLSWYEDHPGPFYVFFSYDKLGTGNMARYTQVNRMYFSDFSYEIETRGDNLYDMWNISIALEEV
jgi:hypothetical protein